MSSISRGRSTEQTLILTSVTLAIGAVLVGYYLAARTHDTHWMNRCGAAIVCLEAFIVIVESMRRHRLNNLMSKMERELVSEEDRLRKHAQSFLEAQIRRAESNVLVVAVLMAMGGEFLHGFGDLLIELIM